MKKLFAAALLSIAMVGCGPDNAGACKKFVAAVKCGTDTTFTDAYCDAYKNLSCDVTPFFDCMSAAYVCTNGQYDSTKLANASTCSSKAVCK
jgi:hypothetical protein